jgi:hypothetical protein
MSSVETHVRKGWEGTRAKYPSFEGFVYPMAAQYVCFAGWQPMLHRFLPPPVTPANQRLSSGVATTPYLRMLLPDPFNPVRAGLVTEARSWTWSSAVAQAENYQLNLPSAPGFLVSSETPTRNRKVRTPGKTIDTVAIYGRD